VRAFECPVCRQLVFFENSQCLRCRALLGFEPRAREIVALDRGPQTWTRCANDEIAGCNWLLGEDDRGPLCVSCRLTRTRPDDDDVAGLAAFLETEAAKRRLVFQLLELDLPVAPKSAFPAWGLAFDLLSSRYQPVVTGHADGVVTLDLSESDHAYREQVRRELGEPYRTLLGHLRHEVAHYYWPILVAAAPAALDRARQLFGDERLPYREALDAHYAQGPPPGWPDGYVSAYATAHPWEDWAETFAHYLHIRDTLQTAAAFGVSVSAPHVLGSGDHVAPAPAPADVGEDGDITAIIAAWLPLTYALNAVNRSMGRDDLYPFVLAPAVIEKLGFVHDVVRASGQGPR
jgi:hypothetical protein